LSGDKGLEKGLWMYKKEALNSKKGLKLKILGTIGLNDCDLIKNLL
jgi:hypothetical protein